jgi:hypothetical protein
MILQFRISCPQLDNNFFQSLVSLVLRASHPYPEILKEVIKGVVITVAVVTAIIRVVILIEEDRLRPFVSYN